jgi:polyketide cyclase/dehydrase/lipid transport protein
VLVFFVAAAAGSVAGLLLWQFAALILAVFLTTAWLVTGLRGQRPASLVLSTLMFLVPAAGFAFYAIAGGPQPALSVLLPLVALLYAVGVIGMLIAIIRRRRSDTIALGSLDRRVARGFAFRLLLTLWLTALLFVFEPLFAIVNVVVNVLWEAIWISRRTRTTTYSHVAPIAAPPQEVFDFIANPGNWPRYRDDVVVVDLEPPGPLRTGSRYTARGPMPATIRGIKERQLEMHIAVLEVVPGRSISSANVARPADVSVTVVEGANGGCRIVFRNSSTSSFIQASQGVMLGVPREASTLKATLDKRMARLNEIFEAHASH